MSDSGSKKDTEAIKSSIPMTDIGLEIDLLNTHLMGRKMRFGDVILVLETYIQLMLQGSSMVASAYLTEKQLREQGYTPEKIQEMMNEAMKLEMGKPNKKKKENAAGVG
jgi:hypothetical protein